MTISRKRCGFFALCVFFKLLKIIKLLIPGYNLQKICTDDAADLVYPCSTLNLSG